ncbi:NAD-dependent epimerase/dehydratase family protein [Tepidibacillus decaturensis]|uniref:UDP-glucose 4-epimerase n=1 Tax=Tepidibacillus decaturensis TaxID=1413211 RepID=A0A135L6W5_9BACI|nr:NAD-dependent epimerase/dehydratase family protein [Tepidibacillus decaturensis]KXG44722.1 UDP-glucose 4-epimerase [Tepidibacillus decaturensis]
MKILVTGGAGFIGHHLAIQLLQKDHHIIIVDELNSYYSQERKLKLLERVIRMGKVDFYQENLIDENFVKELFKQNAFDVVVHLAAMPGVAYSIEHPGIYIDSNIKATINLLKWAGETGVKQVIFASSSSVYGDQEGTPLSEGMANGKVISPYAASKVSGEAFCNVYQQLYGFQLTILRFFTVYGPFGRPDMAISKFIKKLLQGEEIEVFALDSARDYTYIDDIIAGITKAIERPATNEVYNLGFGQPVSMNKLLQEFKKHFPQMRIVKKPWRTGDVKMTWADISKAKEQLGYQPTTSIVEGLSRTITWAKEHQEIL